MPVSKDVSMAEENLIKQNDEAVQLADRNALTIDKADTAREKMTETEIRKRLSGRAMEYLMFIDDWNIIFLKLIFRF